ncbi:MAG: hypothetical protein ACE5F5_09515 [Acidimicrobiia bacterium]
MKNLKRFALLTALALVAMACTTSGSEGTSASAGPTAEQLQAATELATKVQELSASVGHVSTELGQLESAVDQAESSVSSFLASAQVHAIDRTATIPDPPEGKVAVRVSFATMPEPLPGAGVMAYHPLPEVSTVWAMESLDAGAELPVGEPIEDRTIFLAPGEKVAVTLAYENPTEEAVRFLAVPHQDSPGFLNGMIWPQCLCFSFPYEAPAGGAWYRVIEFTASPNIPAGSKVDILWTLLTDESVFPES